MTSQEITDKILKHIETTSFVFDYESGNNSISHEQRYDSFLLEFVLTYDQETKDYLPSNYESPSEYDLEFLPRFISEVAIYINNDLQDLTEENLRQITDNLYWNIIHN